MIKVIQSTQEECKILLDNRLNRDLLEHRDVEEKVRAILKKVKLQGDQALIHYTELFDQISFKSSEDFTIHTAQMEQGFAALEPQIQEALQIAYQRIRDYHQKQKTEQESTVHLNA